LIQLALLSAVILAGAAGDLSVTRAMKETGEVSSFAPAALLAAAFRAARNAFLWAGIFWKAVAFLTLLALLAGADVSWVVPASAVSFVLETLAARYWLRERVSRTRWAGVLCVCAGVALISL
jgi:uncharacterized membrane protein